MIYDITFQTGFSILLLLWFFRRLKKQKIQYEIDHTFVLGERVRISGFDGTGVITWIHPTCERVNVHLDNINTISKGLTVNFSKYVLFKTTCQ